MDAVLHELVRGLVGHELGDGKDGHIYLVVVENVGQLGNIVYADAGYIRADELRPDVVGGEHVEAVLFEAEVLDECAANVADADEYDGEAVSYTHLDVYKRQLVVHDGFAGYVSLTGSAEDGAALYEDAGEVARIHKFVVALDETLVAVVHAVDLDVVHILEPVSYTHLDVYKRQI